MRFGYFILTMLLTIIFVVSFFATNRLVRFCLYTPLKVLLASVVINSFLWVGSYFLNQEAAHSLSHHSIQNLISYSTFTSMVYTISSYSIFLCCTESVRTNKFLLFCSFFVYPITITTLSILLRHSTQDYPTETICCFVSLIVPQIYFYLNFRKLAKKYDQSEE